MRIKSFFLLLLLVAGVPLAAAPLHVSGPDGRLQLTFSLEDGRAFYSVAYDGRVMLDPSPLGFEAVTGNFSSGLSVAGVDSTRIDRRYALNRSKVSRVRYVARELNVKLCNADGKHFTVQFRVSDNDIALRYLLPKEGETGCTRILREATGFDFPVHTTTFLTPQSDPMIGWKRSKPSYEEEYVADAPLMAPSQYGRGFTFPGLFRVGDDGWVLVSETGVDSRYCGSRLSDAREGGLFTVEFPMPEENNGNGTVEPAFALPGATPWRTLTVGADLAPIVETTAPWDNVEERIPTTRAYQFGRGTWSWIVWQDNSINYDDQVRYIDLAHHMGYEYLLIDCAWDTNIGEKRMAELVKYARSKDVDVFLWFSSSGWWNDITQSPINVMDNAITRKAAMRWMRGLGVKGIKVDFFGGDKQETMRLYEEILSDADDHGLMVIFHGCTLPRGWERMYPNFVGSEAVLASENMVFNQHFCDREAFNTALHPFIRNAVASMEFGGCFMNRRLSRDNKSGSIRRTTDAHELATTVLFQNPIQNFALSPTNILPPEEGGAPTVSMDFLKTVPTTWDETRFIDGYPGRYVVLARRHGSTWYVAGNNATGEPLKLELSLPMLCPDKAVNLISDRRSDGEPQLTMPKLKKDRLLKVTLRPNGGFVLTQ